MKIFHLLVALCLVGFYVSVFNIFKLDKPSNEYPLFRERLGTVLSHSDAQRSKSTPPQALIGAQNHIYCYYPSSNANYSGKSGEYIIRRVESFNDCKDWYGIVQFREGPWVSEIEKIWWSKEQKLAEINNSLASEKNIEKLN